jgi:hypothetical protein
MASDPAIVRNETTDDVLEEDVITVPGQLYALVSFVSPTGNQRNDKFGMKIRGCFATRDEANAHVRRLQKFDNAFDIFLVDMYKWLLIPPDANDVDGQEYQEEFLQTMVKGYHENQSLAKQHFLERKQAVMEEGLDKHLTPEERLPPPVAGGVAGGVAAQLGAGEGVTLETAADAADAAEPVAAE